MAQIILDYKNPTWVSGPCRRVTGPIIVERETPIGPREWDDFSLALQEALQNTKLYEFKGKDVGLGFQWFSAMPPAQRESLSMIWRQIKLRLFAFRVFRPWNQIYYTGARIHRIWGANVEPHVEILISEE